MDLFTVKIYRYSIICNIFITVTINFAQVCLLLHKKVSSRTLEILENYSRELKESYNIFGSCVLLLKWGHKYIYIYIDMYIHFLRSFERDCYCTKKMDQIIWTARRFLCNVLPLGSFGAVMFWRGDSFALLRFGAENFRRQSRLRLKYFASGYFCVKSFSKIVINTVWGWLLTTALICYYIHM